MFPEDQSNENSHFFDSKKCILLQYTCGISIATMIASEIGGWVVRGLGMLFATHLHGGYVYNKEKTHTYQL